MAVSAKLHVDESKLLMCLRHSCQHGPGGLLIQKRGILDVLEAIQPRGPAADPKQQSTWRATHARKLARILGKLSDYQFWPEGAIQASKCYLLKVLIQVLSEFKIVVGHEVFDSVTQTLEALAREGQLQEYRENAEADSCEMPRDTEMVDVDSAPSVAPPTDLISEGQDTVAAPSIATTVSQTTGRKRTANEALHGDADLAEYQQRYGGATWMELLAAVASLDKELKQEQVKSIAKDATIQSLRKKCKLLQQQRNRAKRAIGQKAMAAAKAKVKTIKRGNSSVVDTQQQSEAAGPSLEERMAIQRTGPTGDGRYLTVPSKVSLSVRRPWADLAQSFFFLFCSR